MTRIALAYPLQYKLLPLIMPARARRCWLILSSSEDSQSEEENTMMEDEHVPEEASLNSSNSTDTGSEYSGNTCYKEPTYGNQSFWRRSFDDDDNKQLKMNNLPRLSGKIATLSLLAAANYLGSTDLLAQYLAVFVRRIRKTKELIFGTKKGNFNTEDYQTLSLLLANELTHIHNTWTDEYSYVTENYLYNYVVSLNGVLCGTVRGPKQISRSFVRWIHLRLGLFLSLRVRNLKRKWLVRGFRVYRFTPIPGVTVLRIFLRDGKSHRRVMLHITLQPD